MRLEPITRANRPQRKAVLMNEEEAAASLRMATSSSLAASAR